jgi:hypothetical protein
MISFCEQDHKPEVQNIVEIHDKEAVPKVVFNYIETAPLILKARLAEKLENTPFLYKVPLRYSESCKTASISDYPIDKRKNR